MDKAWVTFLLLSALLFSTQAASSKKKVCIVGAGPAGMVTVKHLADHLDQFEPIAFERNSDIGGLWIYDDSTTVDKHGLPIHSSVYKNLRTSYPKELMSCPDYPKFEGEPRSCVRHETVVDYLKNYTQQFDLRRYIKFDTYVEKVTPIPANKTWQHATWDVETRDLNTNQTETTRCHSVIVCTGLFYSPKTPEIEGIEKFPGRVLHSHLYRKPEEFANQTVVIQGGAISGLDIVFELSKYAKTIYLSTRSGKKKAGLPSNIIQVANVVKADSEGLILSDGSKLQADSLIYCTGYKNEMPFLDASSGVEVREKSVYPLYNQVINVKNPSMGFVGLVYGLGGFCPKFYLQANYYISFLLNKFQLPAHNIVMKDAEKFESNNLKKASVAWYWDYGVGLSNTGAFDPLPDHYKTGLLKWTEFRENHLLDYKDYNFKLEYNSYPKIYKPNSTSSL